MIVEGPEQCSLTMNWGILLCKKVGESGSDFLGWFLKICQITRRNDAPGNEVLMFQCIGVDMEWLTEAWLQSSCF